MLQEAHIWNQERQDRWRRTRERGCLKYILKVTAMAFLGAVAVSVVYCGWTLAGSREFHLSTALLIPALGVLSGLITGWAYWGLSERSFEEMNSR